MGSSATATAASKQEARALAAEKILLMITDSGEDKSKKTAKRIAKPKNSSTAEKAKRTARPNRSKRIKNNTK